MTTASRNGSSQECAIDQPTGLNEVGPGLDNYVLESTQKLVAIAELVGRGEVVDADSHTWILAQVDFIVETISKEGLELGDEMRSDLLQFLLAVANLNEQIRHQASVRR